MASLQRCIFNFKTKMFDNTKRTQKELSALKLAVLWKTTYVWIASIFPIHIWPEHNNSNVCGGVLELYNPLCSISIICDQDMYECLHLYSLVHACFSCCLWPKFPCPIYTQSRACWVWAGFSNDGKHSQPKWGSNPWHLFYRLRSLTTWTPSPKCSMLLITLPFNEPKQIFKWHFAITETVCHLLKWQITPLFCPFLYFFQIFTIKCFNYAIMVSYLTAIFTKQ